MSTLNTKNMGKTFGGKVFALLAMLSIILSSMVAISAPAFAADGDSSQAQKELKTYVMKEISKNEYTLEGGGVIRGADLFETGRQTGPDINSTAFSKLDNKSKQQFMSDVADNARATFDESNKPARAENPNVTSETVQNWFKELQNRDGMGTYIFSETLKNVKPDFVAANNIIAPFNGVIGTVIALVAIIIMVGLSMTMVFDLAYIVVPMFQNFVDNSDGDSKKSVAGWVSPEAKSSVKESSGDGGGGKNPLFSYLKKRFWSVFFLGLCLLYLVQGMIFTVVGALINLGEGFLFW